MEKKELDVIVGLMAGIQLSVVHLANKIADQSGLSREAIAESFEATAKAVPTEAQNRQLIQMVLAQVASGIRSTLTAAQVSDQIRSTLH